MNAVPIGVLVEGLIATLLLITIGFCIGLYRRLGKLGSEEHRLQVTIADLATASGRAEGAIASLRSLAEEAQAVLDARAENAGRLIGKLEHRTATAEAVLTRIVAISRAVRPDAPRPAVPRPASSSEEKAVA